MLCELRTDYMLMSASIPTASFPKVVLTPKDVHTNSYVYNIRIIKATSACYACVELTKMNPAWNRVKNYPG